MFQEIYFANPSAAYYFVLGLILVGLCAYSLVMRKKALINFAEQASLQKLLFLERRTIFRYALLLCAWCLTVLALMEPQKIENKNFISDAQKETLDESLVDNLDEEKVIMRRRACDVIFLVDASASMATCDTRMKASRLEYAKEIMEETMSQMDGQNVALYAFTSEVATLVPPTLDYLFTRLLTRNIKINEGDVAGTDLLEALEVVGKKHLSGSSERQTVLVLLTDGGDTYLESLKGKDRENQVALILDKINAHKDRKIKVFTVGLGTQQGEVIPGIEFEGQKIVSSLDTELLSQISEAGHGQYFFANDYSAPKISEAILSALREDNAYIEEEVTPKKKMKRSVLEKTPQNREIINYYQFPLALAVLLLGFELLMPCFPVKRKVSIDE